MKPEEALEKLKTLDREALPEREGNDNDQGRQGEPKLNEVITDKSFYARLRDGEVTTEDIPDELRQEWIRSILGNIPFAYKVSLLGGRVGFVFSELDAELSAFYRKVSRAAGTDLDTQTRLCIVMFLREITGDVSAKFDPNALKDTFEKDPGAMHAPMGLIDKAYDDLCANMPVGLSKLLFGAWTVYSTLVGLMTQDAFPDSF